MRIMRKAIVPYLKQNKDIYLYSTEGRVFTLPHFINNFKHLLNSFEGNIIDKGISLFQDHVPDFLNKPLISTEEFKDPSGLRMKAKSIGGRSAFLVNEKIKLKGCRPIPGLIFPHKKLAFGERKIIQKEIPFGVLSAQNVMREILAFCFFEKKGLKILEYPICVFEYSIRNRDAGYCIAHNTPTMLRLETLEDYYGLNIRDLIYLTDFESRFGIRLLDNRIPFRGIESAWYSETKSDLLINMNFFGGFRGILNSNIGNDIIYNNDLYICDFDTFRVIDIPGHPSPDFIRNFTLWCVVEVLKTSPLIWAYADIEKLNKKEGALRLWQIYSGKSLFWHSYSQKYFDYTERLGWDINLISKTLSDMVDYPVFQELILDNVINSKVLRKTYQPEMSFYVPHN